METLLKPRLNPACWNSTLSGFMRQECIAVYLEEPGILFPPGFPKGIVRLTDLNVDETCLSHHRPPAFTRKAAGYSSRPQIDISHRSFRHLLAVGDIAELQFSPGTQNPP